MSAFLARMRIILAELPSAMALAVLTGVVTLFLAVILSVVTGGEQRALIHRVDQNAQAVVDHAKVTRCEFAALVDILKEIGEQAATINLDNIPDVNTDGLDCRFVLTSPFNPVDPPEPEE